MYCSLCGSPNTDGANFCQQCGADLTAATRDQNLETARTTPGNVEYAGFWKRAVATVIDNVLLSVGLIGIFILLTAGTFILLPDEKYGLLVAWFNTKEAEVVSLLFGVFFGWLYYAGMEASPKQGTVGKMVLKIVVTDLSGARISFAKASSRYFSKLFIVVFSPFISALPLFWVLNPSMEKMEMELVWVILGLLWIALTFPFVMAGFTQRKQALHDMVIGSLVVKRIGTTR